MCTEAQVSEEHHSTRGMVSGGDDDGESARGAYWDGFYVIGQGLQTSPVDNEEHIRNFYQSYDILEKSFWSTFLPALSV